MRDRFLDRLFRQVVTHPVAVGMISLAALVFGWVSYQRLSVELMPDISYPTITVRTVFDGAAPEEVEAQVSRPVEESLATLDGLVRLQSRSRAGGSDVVLGFDWGTDMAGAVQTVRENLQVTQLPEEVERPLILRYDPSLDPILRLALSYAPDHQPEDATRALLSLRRIGEEELKRTLEAMDGVAAVRVRGGLRPEIRVEVREDWLAARGLRLDQIAAALEAENVNVAGGSILEGGTEYLVRTLNEYQTVEEIRAVRIRRADGVVVPLTDVAEISEGHAEREVVSHLSGGEAVELEVFREADSNIVAVARQVHDGLFGADAPDLPEGVVLIALDDQAAFIEDAVANLRDTAVLGGVLAIGILFLFLRDFRATAIIGLAIPVSLVIGFAPLYLRGVSLNLMSLGGLALGIGMLVDNAVVVLESIQRYREEGLERVAAAVRGVGDVATAVVASTLTTVAVFFPIVFVEGVAGELFGDLSIAVVSSLLASLAVALFLVPTLAALRGSPAEESAGGVVGVWSSPRPLRALGAQILGVPTEALRASLAGLRAWRWVALPYLIARWIGQVALSLGVALGLLGTALVARAAVRLSSKILGPLAGGSLWVAGRFQRAYRVFARRYESVLAWSLGRSLAVVAGAFLIFGLGMQGATHLGTQLLPDVHQGRFTIEAALPVGTPLTETVAVTSRLEALVEAHPEVETVYTQIGADRRADVGADEGPHASRLRVQLTPGGDLAAREAAVIAALRATLVEALPRVQVDFSRPSLFTVESPVEVVLFGWDLGALQEAGALAAGRLEGMEGLADVRSSLHRGHPEILVHYDRAQLVRFGLEPGTVARRVRDKVQGATPTRMRRGDERVDLRVQLVEGDRATTAELARINVNPDLRPAIPLSSVATLTEAEGPSEIRRVDQQRAVVVSANLVGLDLGGASAAIEGALHGLDLPEDTRWLVAGQSTEMQDSQASLRFALLLAVFLVYVIMASTFENLLHPLVILVSVPLALVGVVFGLGVVGLPISVVVFLGMIVLAGVVVNNAIVLVDTINRLRREGMERLSAIRTGAALRLRPILITTATTALGLFPLALGLGSGAEVQQPLAVTVIGGLSSATLLTLLVIPAVYEVATRRAAPIPAPAPAEAPEGAG